MARKLRIQYAGALYHVINRGNYRRDLFETVGAAKSFLATMEEAAVRFGWQVHAYVLMRNHFHLARIFHLKKLKRIDTPVNYLV